MQFDNQMSLFIPRVFLNITHNRIRYVFEDMLMFGKVRRVDMKLHRSGKYYSAYVYFERWAESKSTIHFQEKINSKMKALVVYDDPWNWVVLKNNMEKQNDVEYNIRIHYNQNKKSRRPLAGLSSSV